MNNDELLSEDELRSRISILSVHEEIESRNVSSSSSIAKNDVEKDPN